MAACANHNPSNEEGGMPLSEEHPQGQHLYTVIGLHSLHGDPKSPMEWMQRMAREVGIEHNTRLVAPCAPARDGGVGWGDSYQWFPYREDDVDAPSWVELLPDNQWNMLRDQRHRLSKLLTAELDRLPRNGRLLLYGVSQGAGMAMDSLIHFPMKGRHRKKFAGVLSQHGLVQPETFKDMVGPRPRWFKNFPVLALHGMADEMIDYGRTVRLYRQLARLGPAVRFLGIEGLRHSGSDPTEDQEAALFARQVLTDRKEPGLQKAIPIHRVCRQGFTSKRPGYSYDKDKTNMGNTTSQSTNQSCDDWRRYNSDHSTQTYLSGSDDEDAWNRWVEDDWEKSTGNNAWADWGSSGDGGSNSGRNHGNQYRGYGNHDENNSNNNNNNNNNTNTLHNRYNDNNQNQQLWPNKSYQTWDSRQTWSSNRECTHGGSYQYYYSTRSNNAQKK